MPSARCASAISASVPPSPLLSARSRMSDVFQRDDEDQRPEDQRQDAEHGRRASRVAVRRPRRAPPRATRRAGWCRCRRRRRRCCRASAPRSWLARASPFGVRAALPCGSASMSVMVVLSGCGLLQIAALQYAQAALIHRPTCAVSERMRNAAQPCRNMRPRAIISRIKFD